MAPLANLRARVAAGTGAEGRLRMSIVTGDVRKLHQAPEYAGALFQVASQCNLLIRPDEVLSGVSHPAILKVSHDPFWRVLQHRHMVIGCLT